MNLDQILSNIHPVEKELGKIARGHLDNLTKPPGSLGRLEEFARKLIMIYENKIPDSLKKVIFVFAGDHGVAEEGVSAYPSEVTRQMVLNILSGGAGINVLAKHAGAEILVVDIGIKNNLKNSKGLVTKKVVPGTKNMRKNPALTRNEAARCIEVGIDLARKYAQPGHYLLGVGEMGIGNTTPSSAITAVLTGKPVSEVTGKGTGISESTWKNKIRVIEDAISFNSPNRSDPLDVLAKVGGTEIGGIAGMVIGAAANKIPVVIDGFISTAGAFIAYCLEPKTKDYMFASHNSVEAGHRALLEKMQLRPILNLDLRLGEGTGSALAMFIIEAGLKIYKEMATFKEAGVSEKTPAS